MVGKGLTLTSQASLASNGGRGLKRFGQSHARFPPGIARQQWRARIETFKLSLFSVASKGIARQQWRARIETSTASPPCPSCRASLASNGGRGLKHVNAGDMLSAHDASLASNGGRGLKHFIKGQKMDITLHRSPAMAGAD